MVDGGGGTVAFRDIRPATPGRLLAVPGRQAADVAALGGETGGEVYRVGMRPVGAPRRSGRRCDGGKLVLPDGEAAGQVVGQVGRVHPRVWSPLAGGGFRLEADRSRAPGRAEPDRIAARIGGGV